TLASASVALATLAPRGLACRLTPLLASPSPELRAVVPSVVIELAERDDTAAEARACVVAALETVAASPPGAREQAAWIAAALVDAPFTPVLRGVLATGDAPVRRAAAWALGES